MYLDIQLEKDVIFPYGGIFFLQDKQRKIQRNDIDAVGKMIASIMLQKLTETAVKKLHFIYFELAFMTKLELNHN